MYKSRQGFSLVESLVGAAVLVIFFAAIAVMTFTTVKLVGESRQKMMAMGIAQEKMEELRNMAYEDVGTVGGIPDGPIETEAEVIIGGTTFTISTDIVYIDDPYDGVSPNDSAATDYKRSRVEVSWNGVFASKQPVLVWSDITPKGLETDSGGGTLVVQVIEAYGEPVVGAEVIIDAPDLEPAVYLDTTTDEGGMVTIPGAPACNECYRISVTKSGYTIDRTFGSSEVANPAKPHLSVIEGKVAQMTFAIDRTSTVTFRAVRGPANNYSPFQGVKYRVYGSKEIGRTELDEPVYKYDHEIVTGTGGQVVVPGMEWDTYQVEIPAGSSVDFAGSWPMTPFSVLPNTTTSFTGVVVVASDRSLLVRILDNLQSPVSSASVELVNESVLYVATQSTAATDKPDRSQTFFAGLPQTLSPYRLTVRSWGFADAVSEATVSGDVMEQLLLIPE